ncbi:MAG: RNA methyltransferase [Bacteroidales bacterium]|jgi:tRNA G18 (ribose-2'-O)-methylase SpoU|nr:RNA methyltransferase [Bacteroidales bacterium]MBQ5891334.1 RNA methyltransferase [Bacteroidales bacterium]
MREKLSMEQLGRMSVDEFKSSDKFPLTIVVDNVRSMHNVGSIFRTSDAFLVEKIYLCGITPTPPHREIQKTALGATESVDWQYAESTIEVVNQLKKEGWTVLALEQTTNSVMLDKLKVEKGEKIAIVLGNEVEGIDQEVINLCDKAVEIPQFGTKHSFNVSVSCGIMLWQVYLSLK